MANPTWFDETFYLNGKLAQLKAVDPEGKLNDGKAWSSVSGVKAALEAAGYKGDEGLYQHFVDHGMDENISPMEDFDVMFYLQSKADALNAVNYEGKEWDPASVMDAFKAAGIESAWEHYQLYGSSEGIATSADFDSAAYFVAKVKQLNDTGYDTRSNWTVDEVKAAFAEQGLTALEHYQLYGKDEKLDPADFATKDKDPDDSFDIYTGVKTYASLEDALAAQAKGSLAENYTIENYASAGEVTVAQQAGIADLLAGATPAIKADPTYTLVDTVDAIANASTAVLMGSEVLSEDGKSYESGYKIADTLANITAAADGSLVKNAADVTIADLGGDKGLSSSSFDKHVFGSDTGVVSGATNLKKPWGTDTDDLLVATNDESVINLDSLKGKLDWTWTSGDEFGDKEFTGTIDAGKFNNILEGGKGNDTLVGLDGAKDLFLFNSWCSDESGADGGQLLGKDTIYNFEIGTDKLLINDTYALAGKGMIDSSYFAENLDKTIKIDADVDGNATITIDGTFFHDRQGTSGKEDLTITLMGVTEAEAREAGDTLFAFAAE
ncbi:hypothetical protein [uncultured Desulfovibrio sp.]|uniref:hypothetical protein n=1 Tax=uncultured Desulfovibrio sp. TaxID=167968 RepID=UPI002614C0FF|nr:hypothetical protein [uncultured Desulfovibrio sp.]